MYKRYVDYENGDDSWGGLEELQSLKTIEAALTITVTGPAPVLQDDAITVSKGSTFRPMVLANDSAD